MSRLCSSSVRPHTQVKFENQLLKNWTIFIHSFMFSSYELEILLNHDPNGPAYQVFKKIKKKPGCKKKAYLVAKSLYRFQKKKKRRLPPWSRIFFETKFSSNLFFQHGERMHLNRLKLAIKYRQKKVVICNVITSTHILITS